MRGWASLLLMFCFASTVMGVSRCDSDVAEAPTPRCDPGEQRSCTCTGDAWGVQYCNGSSRDFGNCHCNGQTESQYAANGRIEAVPR
ncbi:MAG: hypothetical protein QNJ97_23145 [Myxococcota bacterium]|nr:hypothetical protein [Myxococcota bacterium]